MVVLVLGTGKCGSSAVAGALVHLGVWMGDRFVEGVFVHGQRYPVYEDAEMVEATETVIASEQLICNPFEALVEARRGLPVWGFKYPRLVWAVDLLMPLLDGVRVVIVSRDREETIASCRRCYGLSERRGNLWYDVMTSEIEWFLDTYVSPVLRVQYEKLLEDPREETRRLCEFVGGDVQGLTAAMESIRRPGSRGVMG